MGGTRIFAMETNSMTRSRLKLFSALAFLTMMAAAPLFAQTVPADAWAWRATAYLWMPAIKSTTQLDLPDGGTISESTQTNFDDILSKLKFAFAGTLEGRRGPWSFLGDAQYLNLGNLKSNVHSISGQTGIVSVPIDTGSRAILKQFMGTF